MSEENDQKQRDQLNRSQNFALFILFALPVIVGILGFISYKFFI